MTKKKVVNTLSLARIASFIAMENRFWEQQLSRPIFAGPLSEWGCTSGKTHCLIGECPASQAFEIMCSKRSGSVAVVSSKGKFDAVVTGRDLKDIICGDRPLGDLAQANVLEYLGDKIRRTKPMAFMDDDVAEVLAKMAVMHIDKVFVVDDDQMLVGVVSIQLLLRSMILAASKDSAENSSGVLRLHLIRQGSSPQVATAYSLCRVQLTTPSEIINQAHVRYIWMHIDAWSQSHNWRLLYALTAHGASLKTLFQRCAVTQEPCVTIIESLDGHIFGCFTSEPWRLAAKGEGSYGRPTCFVFTFEPGWTQRLRVFDWDKDSNRIMMQGDNEHVALGGGGDGPALWLDKELFNGASHRSDTFKNICLSYSSTNYNLFQVRNVEVWGLGYHTLRLEENTEEK